MKPRILFVDHVGVLGGGELCLLDIARHFKETSRVVLLDDGPFRESLEQAGVRVEILSAPVTVRRVTRGGGMVRDLRAIPGILHLARRLARQARPYDVIFANSQKSMVVAALAGKLAGVPVVWFLHDLMTTDHFSRLHCRVAAVLGNRFAARIIVNSDASRVAFIENGGAEARVTTIHNGINGGRFEAVTQAEVASLRDELRLNGTPVIGVFSRLAHWKGQHVLLEALKDVPNVHTLFIGDALFEEDKPYAAALRRQAARLGLAERVHFLGFRHDVPQLLSLVDVVVHTSIAPEPFGRVIVEGMLATKPVVATRAGGAQEIIEENKTGLLVPPGDVRALAGALTELLAAPEKADSMARAGQRAAREHFSVEYMLARVAEEVMAVIAPGRVQQ